MTFYEELVMQTQMNFSKYYGMYASGKTPYILTEKKPLSYPEQISRLVRELNEGMHHSRRRIRTVSGRRRGFLL